MATMKYPNISAASMAISGNGSHVDEVDLYSCWQNTTQDEYLDSKLILDSTITNLGSDSMLVNGMTEDDYEMETKPCLDAFDILTSSNNNNNSLAELKPLPPFTNYTANLSINGIPGHHYHAISQRGSEENNNSYNTYNEQNVVSSSTCNNMNDTCEEMFSCEDTGTINYINSDSVSGSNYVAYSPVAQGETTVKTEMNTYDNLTMELFSFIENPGMVDTTRNNANPGSETSRESWTEFENFFSDPGCESQTRNLIGQDGLPEYILPTTPPNDFNGSTDYNMRQHLNTPTNSTLQSLLSSNTLMPLLQNRLQNGPPVRLESPSSTNYGSDMMSASSPPANVVSTTENLMLTVNGRFIGPYGNVQSMEDCRMRSPDMLHNYPHATTTTPHVTKKQRMKAQKRQSPSSAVYNRSTTGGIRRNSPTGIMGKEKPMHRCSICNRGFLNKSNIKVHMRTHTGEKPFRCETCSKSFRQKAHLIKHQQIHKRIGRD